MTCHKSSDTLPMCMCSNCHENMMATMNRIFSQNVEYGQDEYQRDWTEADRDQWGNQITIRQTQE